MRTLRESPGPDSLTAEAPEVSVIVASYNAEKTIETCLESLRSQQTDRAFEVIVVDSGTDGTAQLVQHRFPKARLQRSSERKYCGGARNWGIGLARGGIIAFLDADCAASHDWVENILKVHELPDPAIGGAIANANPDSYVGWAAYFCEFSRWMPETQAQSLDDIAGANMSYKRDLFDRCGRFIEGTYCSDTEFHWRMAREGLYLRFEPSMLVSHHNIDLLGQFIRHEFDHGRAFGRVHLRARDFSRWTRAAKVAGAPVCVLKMLANIVANNMRNQVYGRQFIAALPLVVLGVVCWSTGQVTSYAVGQ